MKIIFNIMNLLRDTKIRSITQIQVDDIDIQSLKIWALLFSFVKAIKL